MYSSSFNPYQGFPGYGKSRGKGIKGRPTLGYEPGMYVRLASTATGRIHVATDHSTPGRGDAAEAFSAEDVAVHAGHLCWLQFAARRSSTSMRSVRFTPAELPCFER
eukprot:s15167_g1.t1